MDILNESYGNIDITEGDSQSSDDDRNQKRKILICRSVRPAKKKVLLVQNMWMKKKPGIQQGGG